jgi:hypothetical protein
MLKTATQLHRSLVLSTNDAYRTGDRVHTVHTVTMAQSHAQHSLKTNVTQQLGSHNSILAQKLLFFIQ